MLIGVAAMATSVVDGETVPCLGVFCKDEAVQQEFRQRLGAQVGGYGMHAGFSPTLHLPAFLLRFMLTRVPGSSE